MLAGPTDSQRWCNLQQRVCGLTCRMSPIFQRALSRSASALMSSVSRSASSSIRSESNMTVYRMPESLQQMLKCVHLQNYLASTADGSSNECAFCSVRACTKPQEQECCSTEYNPHECCASYHDEWMTHTETIIMVVIVEYSTSLSYFYCLCAPHKNTQHLLGLQEQGYNCGGL